MPRCSPRSPRGLCPPQCWCRAPCSRCPAPGRLSAAPPPHCGSSGCTGRPDTPRQTLLKCYCQDHMMSWHDVITLSWHELTWGDTLVTRQRAVEDPHAPASHAVLTWQEGVGSGPQDRPSLGHGIISHVPCFMAFCVMWNDIMHDAWCVMCHGIMVSCFMHHVSCIMCHVTDLDTGHSAAEPSHDGLHVPSHWPHLPVTSLNRALWLVTIQQCSPLIGCCLHWPELIGSSSPPPWAPLSLSWGCWRGRGAGGGQTERLRRSPPRPGGTRG